MPEAEAEVTRNRALRTVVNSQFTDRDASRTWAAEELAWAVRSRRARLGALPWLEAR